MKLKPHIITYLVLSMMTLMPSICFASKSDSTLLNRIWNYRRNYTTPVDGLEQNVYLCYGFSTIRRNPILFLVPTMYVIAQGDKKYVGESYGKLRFITADKYDLKRQVVCGNIPRQRIAMPAIFESVTPNLYNVTIYPDRLLSPFYRANRRFYRYDVKSSEDNLAYLHFRPRTLNTQLISGQAIVDITTGRILSVQFEGEFDMITFKVSALMNQKDANTPLPERCTTTASFKFFGNRIDSHCTAVYNCPTSLPDSLDEVVDKELMEQLRPLPLTPEDQGIYKKQLEDRQKEEMLQVADSNKRESYWKRAKDVFWNVIGDNLINGNGTRKGGLTMRFSPLLNPLYLGYNGSNGISYKLKLGAQYNWNAHRYLSLEAQLGYNFKLKQFYYTIPLRMTYNPKRNGFAEFLLGNGNRISNGGMAEEFKKKYGGEKINMPDFTDQFIQAYNNIAAFDWLEFKTGLVYHRRISTNRELMKKAQMEDAFYSFAPMITIRLKPWYHGPVLTANYEHSFKNIFKSNLSYERWEYDASFLKKFKSMKILNLRAGIGYYTQRSSDYFVDYTNFHDNNLPSGWEDDWSGQFQLLDTRWYNESDYYVRGHASYDSPMMLLYHLPLFGRYIETERIYLSALSIQHTRPYFELGYGFSNRYLSAAVFTNFLDSQIQRVGFKVTIEIFSRW